MQENRRILTDYVGKTAKRRNYFNKTACADCPHRDVCAMGGDYFLLRTRRKVRSEVALLFLGYNLKRAVKVLGFRGIMARLEAISRRLFHILSDFGGFRPFLRRPAACAA